MSTARLAGSFYVVTILTGASALAAAGQLRLAANAAAAASYVAVTLLFYVLFKRVHAGMSAAAATVGLAGCAASALGMSGLLPVPFNPLALFGVYCLLIAWLLARSAEAPRLIGVMMGIGGLSWLTFLFPALARTLVPYNFAPGIVAESALTVWLLWTGASLSPRMPAVVR